MPEINAGVQMGTSLNYWLRLERFQYACPDYEVTQGPFAVTKGNVRIHTYFFEVEQM